MAEANTKQQLMTYEKEAIIDELHNLLNIHQIAKLINNLQQNASKSSSQRLRESESKSNEISGKELNDKMDEVLEQLGIPQHKRDGVLQLPETQKRVLFEQYTKQLQHKAPPPPMAPPSESKKNDKKVRRNTFIIPDKHEIVTQGWLHKRGKINTKYQKRWFVLYHNNTLAYFEKPEHVKNKKKQPLGEISLYFVTQIIKKAREDKNVGKKYKFELISKDRTFILKSEDAKPYYEWVGIINKRINPSRLFGGWAYKKASNKQTFKKRYFVLVNYDKVYSELRYYEDEKMRKFKGMVDMAEVIKVEVISGKEATKKYGRGNDKCLELVTGSRTYVMSFKDISVRDQWKEQVRNLKFDDDITQHIDNKLFVPTDGTGDDVKGQSDGDEVNMGMGDTLIVNPLISKKTVSTSAESDNNPQQYVEKQVEKHVQDDPYYDEEDQGYYKNNQGGDYNENDVHVEESDSDSFAKMDLTKDNGLPMGWVILYAEDGTPYYHNAAEGVTQWDKPQ